MLEAFKSAGDEIRQSFFIGSVSAAVCVSLGLLAVWLRPGILPKWSAALTALLFVLPAPLVGISLITFWNRPGPLGFLYGTDGMLVLGMVSRFLFVALLLLSVAQRSINRDIMEQSLTDGAGWLGALIRVAFPLMVPGVVGALVACLTLVVGEVGVSVLIVPPGGTTLAVRIMTLMHYGPEPVLAATVLILVMIVLFPAVVAAGLVQRLLRGN
jgi:iron(III) transport system permease protein